jgi:hypothetical protein
MVSPLQSDYRGSCLGITVTGMLTSITVMINAKYELKSMVNSCNCFRQKYFRETAVWNQCVKRGYWARSLLWMPSTVQKQKRHTSNYEFPVQNTQITIKKRGGIGHCVWAGGDVVEDSGCGLQNSVRPFIGVPPSGKCMFLWKLSFLQVKFWLNAKAIIFNLHFQNTSFFHLRKHFEQNHYMCSSLKQTRSKKKTEAIPLGGWTHVETFCDFAHNLTWDVPCIFNLITITTTHCAWIMAGRQHETLYKCNCMCMSLPAVGAGELVRLLAKKLLNSTLKWRWCFFVHLTHAKRQVSCK